MNSPIKPVTKPVNALKRVPKSRYVGTECGRPDNRGGMRYVLKPAGLALVQRMASEGNTMATIAASLGISTEAFRRMREEPETGVQEAYDLGRDDLALELTDILLEQARKGNTVAAIYLSKARCGWREGEAMEGGTTNNTQINITIPEAMSDEQFTKLIEGNKT